MKHYLILLITCLGPFSSHSQNNPLKVWDETISNCIYLKTGSYVMDFKSKYLTEPDTVFRNQECVFRRDSRDTIFGFYFDSDRRIDTLTDFYSYNGDYFVSGSGKDARLFQDEEALGHVILIQYNYDFFYPLTNFQRSEMSELDSSLLQFVGEEKIGSYTTFHYRYVPVEDPDQEVQILKSELNFWINAKDEIPVRYSVYYQVNLMGDTLDQYDEYTLTSYSLNNQYDYSFKTPESFTEKGIHINKYRKSDLDSIGMLVLGTKVPDWSFETNKKTKLSSENHSYELVLFDFYYQSCYPCLKAIPFLNELSKKYNLKQQGLLVVGINNVDPVDERFYEFVKRKQISYPLVISPNNLNKEFKVTGYPTLFLMNKKGELIYSSQGYSEQSEAELEKIVAEELQKTGLMK